MTTTRKPPPHGEVGAVGIGAGDEIRTRDIYLGKVVLYQLSYSRNEKTPALTDFSGTLRSEYHWRCCVSRPSSAWGGVVPQRCGHGGVLVCGDTTTQDEVKGAKGDAGAGSRAPCGMMAEGWSRPRLMSTSQLSTLRCLHFWPLNPVVFRETYLLMQWEYSSWDWLPA